MSLDWAALQDDLPVLLASVMGIPVQWRDQTRTYVTGAQATLDILAPTTIGMDGIAWVDVDDTVQATAHGHRELTLQVSVWHHRQPLSVSARYYLERLRTRLRLPSVLEALNAMGLAHVRTEGMFDVDPDEDGRVVSMATMDIRIAYVVSEVDAAIPYIETAHIESAFVSPAGDPLPAGAQIIEDMEIL